MQQAYVNAQPPAAVRRPVTVLDVVMVVSVLLALIALAAWFVIVNPTPAGMQPGPSKS